MANTRILSTIGDIFVYRLRGLWTNAARNLWTTPSAFRDVLRPVDICFIHICPQECVNNCRGVSTVDKRVGELWHHVLTVIEGRLSKPSFETWLKSTEALALQRNTVVVAAPNEFVRDHLERSYTALIRETLREVTQQDLDVKFVLPPRHDETEGETAASTAPRQPRSATATTDDMPQTVLNPKYTFDTFVVGQSNRFAHAACLAVAELPAKAYNPLFIYGASAWARRT